MKCSHWKFTLVSAPFYFFLFYFLPSPKCLLIGFVFFFSWCATVWILWFYEENWKSLIVSRWKIRVRVRVSLMKFSLERKGIEEEDFWFIFIMTEIFSFSHKLFLLSLKKIVLTCRWFIFSKFNENIFVFFFHFLKILMNSFETKNSNFFSISDIWKIWR